MGLGTVRGQEPAVLMDEAYQQRVTTAALEAIVRASMEPGSGVALLRSGEVVEALTLIMGSVLSTSAECSTPASTRKLCDKIARSLQRRISGFQQHATEHGMPFEVRPEVVN